MVSLTPSLQPFENSYSLNLAAYAICWLTVTLAVIFGPGNPATYIFLFILGYGTLVAIIETRNLLFQREKFKNYNIIFLAFIAIIIALEAIVFLPNEPLTITNVLIFPIVYLTGIAGSIFWAIGKTHVKEEIKEDN